MRGRVTVLAVGVAVAVASCSGGGTAGPDTVAEAWVVRPEVGVIQSVSPDGTELLVADSSRICVQSINGSEIRCVDREAPSDATMVRFAGDWSSDGMTFVFLDGSRVAQSLPSALWMLDTREMILRKVFEADILQDLSLGPDGETVALVGRFQAGVVPEFGFFVLREGSDLELVAYLDGWLGGWLPDGSGFLVTSREEDGGLWRISLDDRQPTMVAGRDLDLGRPYVGRASADGRKALIYWWDYARDHFYEMPNVSLHGIVDLATGEVAPLKAAGDGDFLGPWQAAFSSDGDKVIYIYERGSESGGPVVLAWQESTGGEEHLIVENLFELAGERPGGPLYGVVPVWSDNRLVLVGAAGNWALVANLD